MGRPTPCPASVDVAFRAVLTLLTDADLHAPEARGVCHVLVAGGTVVWIGADVPTLDPQLEVAVVPLGGRRVIPGLVDGHVHVTGGGGEGGPATRVPPPPLTAYTRHGVTAVIGLLGTDDIVRSPADVLSRVHGLRAEGLRAWMLTGGYHLPAATVTGALRTDLVHLDPVLGVGEVAMSDHRGTVVTAQVLLDLASEVRAAALLGGKAGSIHLHLGDGRDGLNPLREAIARDHVPVQLWHPTHVNRQSALLDDAIDLAVTHGLRIDVTAFPVDRDDPAVPAATAIARALRAGVKPGQVTLSSDAGGSLPVFDTAGRLAGLGVGSAAGLLPTVAALTADGIALSDAVACVTSGPADQLGLAHVGRLAVGAPADLVVLDDDLTPTDVMIDGRWHRRAGITLVRGTFEVGTDA
jgi:beta-aspartyl-dipeptidase (metallo-type)